MNDDSNPLDRKVPSAVAAAFGKVLTAGATVPRSGTDGLPRAWASDLAAACGVPLHDVLAAADQLEARHLLDRWKTADEYELGSGAPLARRSAGPLSDAHVWALEDDAARMASQFTRRAGARRTMSPAEARADLARLLG